MRSKRAVINTLFGILNQLVLAVVGIVVRKVIINTIGVEYLGVNGLFSNVLSLLSLTESGFGLAIVYKLYRPVADDDREKISQLLGFYSRVYNVIALIITLAGIVVMPFLPYVINETTLPLKEVYIYYILFLLNNVAGYFIAYKTAFLTACQQNYYVMIINSIVTIIIAGIKILVLIIFKNYVAYLVVVILNTIVINGLTAIFADRKYPYLKNIKQYSLPEDEKKSIYKDCKALLYHKIGAYVLTGTDNILISAFVNIVAVGLYSNYLIVINMLNTMLTKLFDAIIPAFGNILALDGREATFEAFKMVNFFNFVLQTFCSGMLLCLIQPFISLVFGDKCLLDMVTVVLLVVNFFFIGMRRPVSSTKNASGIFIQDRYWALVEAGINLVVSLIGVKQIGLPGIFVGTIVSGLLVPNIVGPYFLYRDVFNEKFLKYVLKSLEYYALMLVSVFPVYFIVASHPFSCSLLGFLMELLRALLFFVAVSGILAMVLPERKYVFAFIRIIMKYSKV